MDKRIVITALVSAIGGGVVGGAITYFTVKKKIEEQAQRDIDEVKQAYHDKFDGMRVVPTYSNMPGPAEDEESLPNGMTVEERESAIAFANKLLERNQYMSAEEVGNAAASEEEISVSIYDQVETPEGEEVESPLLIGYDRNALKEAGKPFLISSEEFYQTKTEWDKMSITYYEGDDVLVDESDKTIDNIDYLVGEQHLDFFGLRSGDKNIVFVRNSQISADIEIVRNLGYYTEIVLNVPRNSDKVGTRRMRAGDDE